jgi:OmpA-OmpF porin, OOP family
VPAVALFDTDKAVIKADGKKQIDKLIEDSKKLNVETMIAVGHADSRGSEEHNLKLSNKRSEAVKAYLVSKGVDKARIYTEGKGESTPAADNKSAKGRTQNRRVEVEAVGVAK